MRFETCALHCCTEQDANCHPIWYILKQCQTSCLILEWVNFHLVFRLNLHEPTVILIIYFIAAKIPSHFRSSVKFLSRHCRSQGRNLSRIWETLALRSWRLKFPISEMLCGKVVQVRCVWPPKCTCAHTCAQPMMRKLLASCWQNMQNWKGH